MEHYLNLPLVADGYEVFDSLDNPVADSWAFDAARPVANVVRAARAAEIVRRVNMYNELVASLSTILTMLNKDKDGTYFLCEEAAGYVDEARAVLAKAEG